MKNPKNITQRPGFASILLLLTLLFGLVEAHATMTWQPVAAKEQHGMSHGGMRPKLFQLTEHPDSKVNLWTPSLVVIELKGRQQQFAIRPTGMDSYHALVAEYEDKTQVAAAIRYLHLRGRPSSESPSRLTEVVKTAFEIVPAPLPREHRRYHANHDAVFVARYKGQLLPATLLTLNTSNGSRLTAITDENAIARFTLPDDFAQTRPGERANRPAEFVISSEHQMDGITYRTSLSAPYHADPAHWESLPLGTAVIVMGFAAGLVMTSRGKQNPKEHKSRNK